MTQVLMAHPQTTSANGTVARRFYGTVIEAISDDIAVVRVAYIQMSFESIGLRLTPAEIQVYDLYLWHQRYRKPLMQYPTGPAF